MTSDKRMSGLGLLVLRLVLGVVFLAHGAHEVFGMFGGPGNGPGGLSATSAILGAAGLPQPFLIAVTQGIIELVAGAMLVAGFFTRTASFLLLVFVTAGLWKLRWPWGFFMNWTSAPERGHGMEYGIVLAAALGAAATLDGDLPDLLVIDDPIKDREEANSKNLRDKLWSWFTEVAMTRLMPAGRVVIIMTRWHEDDLIGRLTDLIEFSDASYGRPTLWLVLVTVGTLVVLGRRRGHEPPEES